MYNISKEKFFKKPASKLSIFLITIISYILGSIIVLAVIFGGGFYVVKSQLPTLTSTIQSVEKVVDSISKINPDDIQKLSKVSGNIDKLSNDIKEIKDKLDKLTSSKSENQDQTQQEQSETAS
ncbi:hypothetical protein [Mesomycoplasma bovoculi]|uniref:Uncharacterized protein n=1 Tax=Mesomycoplasma bovoculi M165/69 TaxID=743966 RepID=W5US96_9BACT|nr:hypothetical protein [Mesomycoplasma bovoculi]AHH45099.1 hypothetical protein MYB_00440 [Mesomycoplasma bovoculi M165/69]